MQAVILAGGFGTRLAHIVKDVPKPMAPISGKPFLEYIIETLEKRGVDNFVVLTGYKAELIEEFFTGKANSICVRESSPLGTGGALLNAFEYLQDEFFVINGDTFFDIDFSLLKDFSKDKSCVIALRFSEDIKRYGFVKINDDFLVQNFTEKGMLPNDMVDGYINGGIYYFKKEILRSFHKNFKKDFISIETDIFPELIQSKALYALPLGGCFIDIGIPEDYSRAQFLIPQWIKKPVKPALFIDKDGTIIVNTEYPSGKNAQIIPRVIDIIEEYKKNYHVVMVTNQAGIAKGKFKFDDMFENFDEIQKKLNIKFDDIEYCPYHKDGIINDYKKRSLCRKPDAGMILKACEKLKIDLKNSVMIGDNHEIDSIKLPYLKCIIL